MNEFRTPTSSIFVINGRLFQAAMQIIAAFSMWPATPEWWGFGVLSVLMGLCALANIITAAREMLKVYAREKEIARLAQTSRAPEPSDLAGIDALKNAGMLND